MIRLGPWQTLNLNRICRAGTSGWEQWCCWFWWALWASNWRGSPGRAAALAATAWHRRLLCPDGTDGPIGTFVSAFRDQGPEKGFV